MNKEMINEMASDMDFACVELSKEQRIEIARTLINLDYRKMTEPIKLTPVGYGKENGCYYADIIATGQEFPQRIYFQASLVEREAIRKETAKEIFGELVEMLNSTTQIRTNPYSIGEWGYLVEEVNNGLKELAKKYGVKVE